MGASETVLVVNPQAQNGALGRRWPELSSRIRRELGAFVERFTEAPGDATRLTREALRGGADMVVAIGGDGTINEVVNGFFEAGEPVAPAARLGVLPFGTGGDFRKSASIPKDLDRAAAIVARGHTRAVDVGRLDFTASDGSAATRMFLNIASFGMSGVVDELVNESSKRLGGRLSFLLATARAGLRYHNRRVRLVFDGDQAGAVDTIVNVVAVANGRYFGGGMHIAPEAELDDGRFDVVAVGDLSMGDMLLKGMRLYKGTHLGLEQVSSRRASVVVAEPLDGEVLLDVDGEAPGRLPATFTILPGALRLVVPA